VSDFVGERVSVGLSRLLAGTASTHQCEQASTRSGTNLWQIQFHWRAIHAPQHADLLPALELLAWNANNVFKTLARAACRSGP